MRLLELCDDGPEAENVEIRFVELEHDARKFLYSGASEQAQFHTSCGVVPTCESV